MTAFVILWSLAALFTWALWEKQEWDRHVWELQLRKWRRQVRLVTAEQWIQLRHNIEQLAAAMGMPLLEAARRTMVAMQRFALAFDLVPADDLDALIVQWSSGHRGPMGFGR